jgi:hypothetical protein
VHVVAGLVSGKRSEVTLQIGEQIILGGGGGDHLAPELQTRMPPGGCPAPYWVVGAVLSPPPATP